MKVLGKSVLIEQILTKKDSPILHIEEKPEDDMVYESEMKVLEIGPECPESPLAVGDVPMIAKWAEPSALKAIEGKPGDYKLIRHLVYSFESVVAIDNP